MRLNATEASANHSVFQGKKKIVRTVLAAIVLLSAVFYGLHASRTYAKSPTIMEFSTMAGVPRPYTGAANAIRGINGGGLPWVISSAEGELKQSGELELTVTGLVIDPNDPAAIAAGRAGINPIASFKAIVSCLSKDANGAANVVNVSTDPFPATTGPASAGGGNASVEAQVSLPTPCIAPIIFVTSPTGAWFAATGR